MVETHGPAILARVRIRPRNVHSEFLPGCAGGKIVPGGESHGKCRRGCESLVAWEAGRPLSVSHNTLTVRVYYLLWSA